MGLSDITADAVGQAIAEFDRVGREAFLAKYGFSEARSYFLVHQGRHYDSKAILGAAHGYLGFDRAPLRAVEFSGGESATARVLQRLGYEVVNERPRNPAWTRDEIILALDFYRQHRERLPGNDSAEIAALSKEIGKVGRALGLSGDESFRNANGVHMKLMNLRRLDPEYTSEGSVGLQRGGRLEEEVWNALWSSPGVLANAATAIRLAAQEASIDADLKAALIMADEPEISEAIEGAIVTRLHRRRERDRKIVEAKKKAALGLHGRLVCEACGFDFVERYGERGQGFIECHHVAALSASAGPQVTRLHDLALLCANCHRMVHARSPWLTLEGLIELLRRDRAVR